MTRKPTPATEAEPKDATPSLPTHPLPTEGGTYLVVDGALLVDPRPETPNPDPEV